MKSLSKDQLREIASTLHEMELTSDELALVEAILAALRKDLRDVGDLEEQHLLFEPAPYLDLTKGADA